MTDMAIKVEHVGKKFSKDLKRTMFYGAVDILQNASGMISDSATLRRGEFWAVDDVSFELKRGETLGIIGPNGSGKTTLLKMLNGIFMPDKGRIEIKGRVGALIQLGAGFHPLLTGRENIYVNGAILGMKRREIDRKFDSIVEFADIGEFLDSPVRHYSSGMYVRLGFAIAIHCDLDVLLVDEVLAVGDARFYSKCTAKIRELTARDTTIVLVSHNMWLIQTMCDRAILLKRGRIDKIGSPSYCIREYSTANNGDHAELRREKRDGARVAISFAEIRNLNDTMIQEVKPDDSIVVFTKFSCLEDGFKAKFRLNVATPDGYPLYTSYSSARELRKGDGQVRATIQSVSLLHGEYRVWVGLCDGNDENRVYDAVPMKLDVCVSDAYPDPRMGIYYNKVAWNFGDG